MIILIYFVGLLLSIFIMPRLLYWHDDDYMSSKYEDVNKIDVDHTILTVCLWPLCLPIFMVAAGIHQLIRIFIGRSYYNYIKSIKENKDGRK